MNNKGFTLIEVTVTIAILVLIAGVSIPSVINVSNKKDKQQCEKLVNLVNEKSVVYYKLKNYITPQTITLRTLMESNLFDKNTKCKMFEKNFNESSIITINKNSENEIIASINGKCE